MIKVFFVWVVVIFGCNCAHSALEEKTSESVHLTFSSSDIVSQSIELINTLADTAKEQEYISVRDNARLRSTVERLIQDNVLGLTAAERQELVKDTIGEENYSVLEQVFMKQLRSSDIVRQKSALLSLGFPMFALDSADEIKTFVFHKDRYIQLLAVKSLVYLDVPGADYLLYNVLLCGLLSDYDTASAIEALYITNNKELDRVSSALVKMNPGALTFKSLLPVLEKKDDYHQIIATIFKSNLFYVPDKEDLTLEERSKISAEHNLLENIFTNPSLFMADEDIKRKVTMYANSQHSRLSTLSLLILEKSGQKLVYFTEMLKNGKLTNEKKRTLEYIISRIQKGERLE